MADNVVLNPGTGGATVRAVQKGGVDSQVLIIDAGGAGAESLVSATNPLPTSINALSYPASAGNSSTAQLAAGAAFTGAIETIQNQQAGQIEVYSDQPFQLQIIQYIDAAGANPSSTDTFFIGGAAGPYTYNQNVSLPGNYFNLIVTNAGVVATTTLRIDTTYGIMATGPRTVTALGNNRSALNEVGGKPIALGPQPQAGSIPVVIASDQAIVDTVDQNILAATSSDAPLFMAITGDPGGPFANVNLIEEMMDPQGSGLGLNVRVQNPPLLDINGAALPSDAPQIVRVYGVVGSKISIPTQYYQSIAIAATTLAGTISGTVDNVLFSAIQGTQTAGSAPTSTMTAGANWIFPCPTPTFVVTVTTAGWMSYVLRQTPYVAVNTTPFVAGANGVNGGISGIQAVGGNIATNAAPTANPVYVAGLDTSTPTNLTRPIRTDPTGRPIVAGDVAPGVAPSANPVAMAGVDPSGFIRRLGILPNQISGIGTLPVQDSSITEGLTNAEILWLILAELRLLNYYAQNLGPPGTDSPEVMRAEPGMFFAQ